MYSGSETLLYDEEAAAAAVGDEGMQKIIAKLLKTHLLLAIFHSVSHETSVLHIHRRAVSVGPVSGAPPFSSARKKVIKFYLCLRFLASTLTSVQLETRLRFGVMLPPLSPPHRPSIEPPSSIRLASKN